MDYVGNVIRPPSEANSIILQVTVGCTHNKCTFCGAYKDVAFRIKSDECVNHDIKSASQLYHHCRKLFLADGDVLSLSQKRLVDLFVRIRAGLPKVARIRLYGSAKSILSKTPEQLAELRELGLDRIYMGLESGCDSVLQEINKWGNKNKMVEAAKRAKAASIFLSVTVLLGIAGLKNSTLHAQETAQLLNKMAPNQIAALTLMLVPGTVLYDQHQHGQFVLPSPHQLLQELYTLIKGIHLQRSQFQANHASNYLPINCRLNRDKEHVLRDIRLALAGENPLMPEFMRGL